MLFEAFKRQRTERPGAAAFLVTSGDRSVPISWRQFTDDIETIVSLIDLYCPEGTVGLIGENSYEWMVSHAACLFAGATVVPIEPGLNADDIAARLRFVGADALIYSSLYVEKAREVGRLAPELILGGFGTTKTDGFLDKARQAIGDGRVQGVFSRDSVDTGKVSMLVFTSGTTSRPRGAQLTIAGIEEFCAVWGSALGMKPSDRSLMVLPLHHIFGICSTYLMLTKGVALGVCPDFRRLYDAVERFRVNYLMLVPALADILATRIAQHGPTAEAAFGTPIDWILVGGAPLARSSYERLRGLGIKAITAYGLTETTALFSVSSSEGEPKVGSAGRAPRGGATETRVSEAGELLVRGPGVFKGYFKEPERTEETLGADGWFRTGDLGRIDADGTVWITGRATRTIVLSSGKKIAPEELEEKLLSLPGVLEAVVTGDGETREVCAEIYASVSEEQVRRLVGDMNRRLPVYMRIGDVTVRGEPFPRTASGKIRVEASPRRFRSHSSPQAERDGARRVSMGWVLGLGLLALAIAVLGFVPNYLASQHVELPPSARVIFGWLDLAGEILLVVFAVWCIVRAKSSGGRSER